VSLFIIIIQVLSSHYLKLEPAENLLQESWRGEEAGRQLVLALCENLRCGSQVLEQALLSYHTQLGYQAALWNRNRRNRNFLTSGTGTGTGTVTR
jgi:hypothetical protein